VSRTIDLIDVELQPPWEGSRFQWLTPVEVKSQGQGKPRSYRVYRFPGKHGLQLEYCDVLNHHLLERRKLPGKRRLEGWLLGVGGLMPAWLRHGQWLDMTFTIIGADRTEYARKICLWTERLYSRKEIMKPRTSIFAELAKDEATFARDVTPTTPLSAGQPPASNAT
jgi:hypothetical protein